MKSLTIVSKMVVAFGLCTVTTGCLTDFGGDTKSREFACVEQAIGSYNGMDYNGLDYNAMWDNALWGNGLWNNGLWANGFWANGLLANGLTSNGMHFNGMYFNGVDNPLSDPLARQAFESVRGSFDGNRARFLDVLEAARRVLAVRLGSASASRDVLRSRGELIRSLGFYPETDPEEKR